ncbi:unnamed protein product [Didymodactylos carnosus]|uniref:Uncharacterized protein n=1 Tax=Didymodactylos carnosus TaxID=1234261 RepID=A0A8S2IGD3_9BILA|nr:unnamed protein product [Didymodactylos carnosus]CAF3749183.1 unnamed protein product [Didymodactylos carnosus]
MLISLLKNLLKILEIVITIGGIYTSESSTESSSLNKTIDTDFNIKQAAEFKFALIANGPVQGDNSKTVLTEWITTIDKNYAVVKRQSSPLYELFEKQYLQPSFGERFRKDYGSQLSDVVRNIILTFYEYNVHRDCLNINSENFNPSANLPDEDTCNIVPDKYRFGGLFTGKCLEIKNILGGDHNCIANYSQYAVFQNVDPQFNLYFCYSDERFSIHQTQHAYFGGIHTNVFKNPVTQDYSCPREYEEIPLEVDHTKIVFCLSRDVTLPTTSMYKFGGTFSRCNYYNPMANEVDIDDQIPPTRHTSEILFKYTDPIYFQDGLTTTTRNKEMTYWCLRHVLALPPNYRFSKRQIHEQYLFFKSLSDFNEPSGFLDLCNAAIVIASHFVQALLITHAQCKLNTAPSINCANQPSASHDRGGNWRQHLVRPPRPTNIATPQ